MTGQVWSVNADGGYLYSDELSDRLRTAVQPLTRFRQFCDAKLAKGKNRGDTYNWNVYSDVEAAGRELTESNTADIMPSTKFTITRGTATVTEYGNSVPFTEKLDSFSLHPVTELIEKALKNDAAKVLDRLAHNQFLATNLVVKGTGTGSSAAIAKTYTGTPQSGAPNVALETGHVKLIADELVERDIPAYDGVNYCAIFRPRALRKLKDQLEEIHKYVSEGWYVIMNGERGRYEGVRFIEQTNIAQPGAYDATNNPNGWRAVDATGSRGRGYFFGADTVVEAVTVPEEIRARIPGEYGLKRGIAWYYLGGFAIIHNVGTTEALTKQNRIIRWDSAYTA